MPLRPLLSLVGPTATGKTDLILQLIESERKKYQHIDVISADSRQLYEGMEIGTGVDLPSEFRKHTAQLPHFKYPYFVAGLVRFHGVNFLSPVEEWSVTHFHAFARSIIDHSWQGQSLPIVVGGTGLYHEHLFSNDPQLNIPPNVAVRKKAETLSVEQLQAWLQGINEKRLNQMNNSDRSNPRRLVRAIEHVLANEADEENVEKETSPESNHLFIGLTAPVTYIESKIEKRIHARLQHGMIEEVQKLIHEFDETQWRTLPAFTATGYKEVRGFIEERYSREEMVSLWKIRELQYAKRQITWWKKVQKTTDHIHWFDVSQPSESHQALDFIRRWLDDRKR